jgi:predicted nucleic acid-binding protein
MTVVSDTNVLSSLAAAHSLVLLQRLFRRSTISIPPAVRDELQVAVDRGRTYLEPLVGAISAGEITTLELTEEERALVSALPRKLTAGEREAIALCQQRRIPLLSNDRRAIRYCQASGIDALDLATLLRLFWTQQLTTRVEVEQIIARMEQVERLTLSAEQRAAIFAPLRRRR